MRTDEEIIAAIKSIMQYTDGGLLRSALARKVMGSINPVHFEGPQFMKILEKLVESKELVQLYFTKPNKVEDVLYFCKGTKIRGVSRPQIQHISADQEPTST